MKNRWFVMFAVARAWARALVLVAWLFGDIPLMDTTPGVASAGVLGLAFRALSLPVLDLLARLLPTSPPHGWSGELFPSTARWLQSS